MHVLRYRKPLGTNSVYRFEVGSYAPNGDWEWLFHFSNLADAISVVNCLNGGAERLDAATVAFLLAERKGTR